MPGPLPKSKKLRQRRNKATDTATLPAEPTKRKRAPKLPELREWNDLTRTWWRDIWRSPMANEFIQSDVHGLVMLAVLVDRYWTDPDPRLASEIRLQGRSYGLSPVDRQRLRWEVKRVEGNKARRPATTGRDGSDDPRSMLTLIK